ncbi:MAG: response regulator [Coriobacteriaceae bacterium]|uniref:response regulator n=1 Tax=Tractidigestivibacter sp. TaxID=2847320 RepID=UPI002A800FEA|nr:response regulator [Tractidigestivibacter sp.]MCI6274829.1 response regulator [Coriobacteriaceae bacterium]MCI6548298.1 response regulator [Coriobacteriaceae bacterium]MCI6845427.1 response regulator [Coriobacteriaceae bacterium]MCI7438540.1 response regulator [Coriobacteriaceae bacterium]MDD7583250.1 response regulator [Coriobacteriaceae bacterium]
MRPAKLLFVCSDAKTHERFKRGLAAYGCDVVMCYRAEEAFRIIRSYRIDVVIFSVELQDMSGYEACRRLRERYNIVEQPAVIYSTHDSAEERLAAFRSGANIFTFEPVLFDRLYYVLMLLVRSKRMMQRSMSLDQVLRVADKQIAGNAERPARIEGPHGTLVKSDVLRWTDVLTQSVNLEQQPQAIVHEMVNLTLDLVPRFGSIEGVLSYLGDLWEGTSARTELARVFGNEGKRFSLDVDHATTDGACALMLMFCEEILDGHTPSEALSRIAADGSVNHDEVEALRHVLVADDFMSNIFG